MVRQDLSDYEVAVSFEMAVIKDGDIDKAMTYAHPDFQVREAPSTPYRSPIVGAAGLRQLREDVNRYCECIGAAETEYFLVRPGLVVGRIRRDAVLRATGEPFNFLVTEWITVTDGKVSDVEVFYFENAPLAAVAAMEAGA